MTDAADAAGGAQVLAGSAPRPLLRLAGPPPNTRFKLAARVD
jgi:hypothetical protein